MPVVVKSVRMERGEDRIHTTTSLSARAARSCLFSPSTPSSSKSCTLVRGHQQKPFQQNLWCTIACSAIRDFAQLIHFAVGIHKGVKTDQAVLSD